MNLRMTEAEKNMMIYQLKAAQALANGIHNRRYESEKDIYDYNLGRFLEEIDSAIIYLEDVKTDE